MRNMSYLRQNDDMPFYCRACGGIGCFLCSGASDDDFDSFVGIEDADCETIYEDD